MNLDVKVNESQTVRDVLKERHPKGQSADEDSLLVEDGLESENENVLPFMDVEVKKISQELHRTVYQKPTFTALYTPWHSFCPRLHKIAKYLSKQWVPEASDTLL